MDTSTAQKQREIDMAWEQYRNPTQTRVPTEREIWEAEEKRRAKGKL